MSGDNIHPYTMKNAMKRLPIDVTATKSQYAERVAPKPGKPGTARHDEGLRLPPRPPWYKTAACLDPSIDINWFWPERGDGTSQAKAVCATCPVVTECLNYGINEIHGIWGGTSPMERRRLRRIRNRGAA